ncbi:hypothetical protein [Faecalimicrobium sp. JNUCC 81]
MKKRLMLLVGFTFIIMILFFFIKINTKIVSNEELNKKIIFEIESKKELDFSKVANFDWDTMMIFHPYSDINSKFKDVNIDNSINTRDDINTIVFIKNNKIVEMVNIDIKYDFDKYIKNKKIENKHSKFKVKDEEDDYYTLYLE